MSHAVGYTHHKRWMSVFGDENWGMIQLVKSNDQ